jgi:hypothetical protein
MAKRIVIVGTIAAVFVAALIATLAALDVVAVRDLTETLGRTVLVIAIATGATVVVTALARSTGQPRAVSKK